MSLLVPVYLILPTEESSRLTLRFDVSGLSEKYDIREGILGRTSARDLLAWVKEIAPIPGPVFAVVLHNISQALRYSDEVLEVRAVLSENGEPSVLIELPEGILLAGMTGEDVLIGDMLPLIFRLMYKCIEEIPAEL